MATLNERTVLTCLHIGNWSGKMIDQEVTEEVSDTHHAEKQGAGTYSKQLVAKKFLKNVNSKVSTTRKIHRLLTLPWDDDARILSNTGFIHYSEQMRMQKLAVEAAANSLCSPDSVRDYIHEAKNRLGTMFNHADYPTAENIRKKYWVDVEIKPVPVAGDFRAELDANLVKSITKDIERRTEERMEKAVEDVFQRIAVCTGKMVERLRSFKPATVTDAVENNFHDTLVWNIRELADLIPSLNITNDKRLDDLHTRLLADCTKHEPDKLKQDAKLRQQTADAAEKILKKVNSYLA